MVGLLFDERRVTCRRVKMDRRCVVVINDLVERKILRDDMMYITILLLSFKCSADRAIVDDAGAGRMERGDGLCGVDSEWVL